MRNYFTVIHYHTASPTQFSTHLTYLEQKFNIGPLSLLRDHYQKGTALPENSLFITFDDGWKSNYELLPVIEEHETPITIFLSTGLVGTDKKPGKKIIYDDFKLDENLLKLILDERTIAEPIQVPDDLRTMLNKDEIKEMSRVIDFQSHGVNHHVSSAIPVELMDYELRESKRFILKLTGKDVFAFAFPYNVISKDASNLLLKHGYTIARAGTRQNNYLGTDSFKIYSIGMVPTWSIKQLRRALNLAELKSYLAK